MIPNMIKVADPLPETACPETACPEPLGATFMDTLHKQRSDLITINQLCQGIACFLMDANITAVNAAEDCTSISRLLEDNGALIMDIMNRLHLIITKIG